VDCSGPLDRSDYPRTPRGELGEAAVEVRHTCPSPHERGSHPYGWGSRPERRGASFSPPAGDESGVPSPHPTARFWPAHHPSAREVDKPSPPAQSSPRAVVEIRKRLRAARLAPQRPLEGEHARYSGRLRRGNADPGGERRKEPLHGRL
jgi:hypothetical protein